MKKIIQNSTHNQQIDYPQSLQPNKQIFKQILTILQL